MGKHANLYIGAYGSYHYTSREQCDELEAYVYHCTKTVFKSGLDVNMLKEDQPPVLIHPFSRFPFSSFSDPGRSLTHVCFYYCTLNVVYFGHKGKYTLRLCHSAPWMFRGVFLSRSSNRFGKVSHSTCPKGHRSTIGL